MGQRVNIQYSVDIGELESEAGRLLHRAQDSLAMSIQNIKLGKTALSLETAKEIDKLRLELAQADKSLEDVSKIIAGYLSYEAQAWLPQAPPSPPTQHGEDLIQNLEGALSTPAPPSSIHEAIEDFRNSLGASDEKPAS